MSRSFDYVALEVESKVGGTLLLGRSDKGVCWLSLAKPMDDQRSQMRHQLDRNGGREITRRDRPELVQRLRLEAEAIAKALDAGTAFPCLPLDLRGTEFQKSVWDALQKIPTATRSTYSDLASLLGVDSKSARAIGTAVGANPVSLLVPCHLVARRDGGLGGYRWGLDIKRRLLPAPAFEAPAFEETDLFAQAA